MKLNMNKTVLMCALWLLGLSAYAEQKQITSPDGRLVVKVDDKGGKPSYEILYNERPFLLSSPLGLDTNIGDFTQKMELTHTSTITFLEEEYQLQTIKQRKVHYHACKGVFTFSREGKPIYDVIFQVSNHDVAFKYQMFSQGNALCCVINEEATGFVLSEGCTTFLCPQSKPMGGFARTSPSYETPYTVDDTLGKNGWGQGYTFPCLFRNEDKGWILISETGVSS